MTTEEQKNFDELKQLVGVLRSENSLAMIALLKLARITNMPSDMKMLEYNGNNLDVNIVEHVKRVMSSR